jgi:hypothetical protein
MVQLGVNRMGERLEGVGRMVLTQCRCCEGKWLTNHQRDGGIGGLFRSNFSNGCSIRTTRNSNAVHTGQDAWVATRY